MIVIMFFLLAGLLVENAQNFLLVLYGRLFLVQTYPFTMVQVQRLEDPPPFCEGLFIKEVFRFPFVEPAVVADVVGFGTAQSTVQEFGVLWSLFDL